MASLVYNQLKYDMGVGNVDLASDTINCALLANTYTPDPDDDTWADVSSHEVSGTGYNAGGEALSGKSVTKDDTSDLMKFDATDVTWSSSTITARHAVLYDVTNADSLVCVLDFGSDQSSSNGDFTIQWNASGILTLT
jgi:hypothetical protein